MDAASMLQEPCGARYAACMPCNQEEKVAVMWRGVGEHCIEPGMRACARRCR